MKRVFLFGLLALCVSQARATDYFVATNGDDSADGLTTSTAWRTVGRSANRLAGGDRLLLRGGIFREHAQYTNNSGSAGAPIVVEAYSNETPILRGSDVETNWTFVASNTWRATGWTNTQQVFVDGLLLQQLGWPHGSLSNRTCSCFDWLYIPFGFSCAQINPATQKLEIGNPLTNMPPNSFYVDVATTSLYINVTNGFLPGAALIEVSRRVGTFWDQSSVGWLRLKNLTFQHANSVTFIPAGAPFTSIGLNGIIEDCVIEWGDGAGINMQHNATVRRCVIQNNGIQGVHCNAYTNMLVEDCTIVSNNYRRFNYTHAAGLKFIPHAGATVRRCEVAWNHAPGIWFDTCLAGHPLVVEGNYAHDNTAYPDLPGEVGVSPTAGIFIEKSVNAWVFNNRVVSNAPNGLLLAEPVRCHVYNNVITGTRAVPGGHRGLTALALAWSAPQPFMVSNRVVNNVIYNNQVDYDLQTPSNDYIIASGNEIDHNLYYRDTGAGIYCTTCTATFAVGNKLYPTFAAYRAGTGFDTNGLNVAPMLAPDGRPLAGSPCIDAGQISVPLGVDRAGVPRGLDGNGDGIGRADLGLYEFTNGVALVRYVDANATNPIAPYVSRETAARQIQPAVDAAANGDFVVVSAGVYSGGVAVTKGIAIVGEAGPSATTLDGASTFRVLGLDHSNAVVDGFTLLRGSAAGGGGLRLEGGALAQNCWVVSNNSPDDAGGIYAGPGGRLHKVKVFGNTAGARGGGVFLAGSASADDCEIQRNAAGEGGGLFAAGGAALSNLDIRANTATNFGGGIVLGAGGRLYDATVAGNTSLVAGGIFLASGGATAEVARVFGNVATMQGGGAVGDTNAAFRTCVFYDNRAGDRAGGLYLATSTVVRFCTIAFNSATNEAGGLYGVPGSLVLDSIVTSNTAPVAANFSGAAAFERVCAVPIPAGSGNIGADPLFVNAAARDLRLRFGSPCIDGADMAGAPFLDFDDSFRTVDGNADHVSRPDLGAYESRFLRYVKAGNAGAGPPYFTWATAAPDIPSAILHARDGDVILVGDGTYGGGLNVYRAVAVTSASGPGGAIIDGLDSTRCVFMSHAAGALEGFTIRRGRADSGGGVYFNHGGTVRRCRLEENQSFGNLGGTLGYATTLPNEDYCGKGAELFVHEGGGGVLMHGGGLLENCLLVSNRASFGAGAATVDGGTIQNCTLVGNIATNGGGAYGRNGGLFRNSIFFGNSAVAGSNYFVSGTGVIFSSSCAAPLPVGSGNLSSDPLLNGAYRLTFSSPCIDAGTSAGAPALDLDGLPRPLDGDAAGGSAFDVGAFEYASTNADSDADGLSDAAEVTNGTQILNADTDGDRMRDGDEIVAGTIPTNATSYFALTQNAADVPFVVRWNSATGRWYYVQRATNLLQSFEPWVSNILAVPPANAWTDGPSSDAQRFYRVGVQP